MDTFDLLPSLARGELRETSAAELVAAIFRSRASGTLALEVDGGAEVRVFFRAGDMCGCAHFQGFRTLAQVLLANDWVGALAIDETRAQAAAEKKRHGQVLVERGLLSAERMLAALALQHQYNLSALFALEKGRYEWRGWEPPPPWAREVTVEPVGVIATAFEARRLGPRREAILRWLGKSRVRLSQDWPDLSRRIVLSEDDLRATRQLASPIAPEAFVARSGLSPARAESLLVALLLAGGVDPTDEAPAAPRVSEQEAIARIESLELEAEEEPPAPPAAAPAPAEAPGPGAGSAAVAAAARSEAGSEVRRRLLARGLRNLGQGPAGAETPAAEAAPPSPAQQPPAQPDAEALRFMDEVRLRARRAAQQNPYQRLGVEASAPQEAIRAAYLEQIKRFHPDRAATPALEPVAAELRALFDALQEAFQAIGTPAARAAYAQGEQGSASRAKEAEVLVKMGEVLLKKRDFAAATAKLRQAVALEAGGDALAALAWALMTDPGASADEKEEVPSLLRRALAAAPTARAHYVAGVFARSRDPAGAADHFRKALELERDHPDAALELRLLEMRSRPKEPQPKTGLSGWFSKRKG